jgi:hypothetical protein
LSTIKKVAKPKTTLPADINPELRETGYESNEDLSLKFERVKLLTQAEDMATRGGRRKHPTEVLLFLASQNVNDAHLGVDLEEGIHYLYVRRQEGAQKDSELIEGVKAMQEYSGGQRTQEDALHTLSEVSDVIYNIAQAGRYEALESVFRLLSDDYIIHFLLDIATDKFSLRYLEQEALRDDILNIGDLKEYYRTKALKNVPIEEAFLMSKYGTRHKVDFVKMLEGNWHKLHLTLLAIESRSRRIVSEMDPITNSIIARQLVNGLDDIPQL